MAGSFLIGYARVSTDDQDLSLQTRALERYGVPPDRIFVEKASGKTMKRKVLSGIVRHLRPDDVLVVWKLDRLGRTLTGVLEVLERIDQAGCRFVSLTEQFDTTQPMGRAMLQVALVFAELERSMISERTKAGMAEAKRKGAIFGRKNTITDSRRRLNMLRRMDRAGDLRDGNGELLMPAHELMAKLNAVNDPSAARIANPETVRRWKRAGFPGLEGAVQDDDFSDEGEVE